MSSRIVKTVAITVTLLLCVVALVWLFDWNMLRGVVERRVASSTGRDASIGHLSVKLGWQPTIRVDSVRLGNVPWGSDKVFFTADAVTLWS